MKSTVVVLLVVIFGLSQSDSEPGVYRIETGTNDCKPCEELSFPCESEHIGAAGSRHFCLCKGHGGSYFPGRNPNSYDQYIILWQVWGNEAAKICLSSVHGPCGESSDGAFKVGCGDKLGIDPGLICKDKRCVAKIGLNVRCFETKHCQDGLICNQKTRRCVKPKSLKHTDFCSADEECEKGLKCLSVEYSSSDKPGDVKQCCAETRRVAEQRSYNEYLQSDVMKAGDVRGEGQTQHSSANYAHGPLQNCCKNEHCTGGSRILEPIPIIMILSILHFIE